MDGGLSLLPKRRRWKQLCVYVVSGQWSVEKRILVGVSCLGEGLPKPGSLPELV